MRHYTTVCDAGYLPRLKVLVGSMRRHCMPFTLHVLAWDVHVEAWCQENMDVVRYGGQTSSYMCGVASRIFRGLLPGPPRGLAELMWTVRSGWSAWVMRELKEPVTQIDADLMFWSTPEPVYKEIGDAPAAVVPHGFAPEDRGLPGPTAESHRRFGLFNAGWVYVADPRLFCLWAAQCWEWCHRGQEDLAGGGTRYSDQAYLDTWPEAHGAHVVKHLGVNVGPWNIHTRMVMAPSARHPPRLVERRELGDGGDSARVDPLVAYHYHSLELGPSGVLQQLAWPEYGLTEQHHTILYVPYIAHLKEEIHGPRRK